MMPDWTAHLNPTERARLAEIDAALAGFEQQAKPLRTERKALNNRARQRKWQKQEK